ncbi:host cell division inhibitor Icd-like protein [Enterobacter cancerogenus]|uniref:host cell division inhibitor Icd-like protein n=1 Tax=Enterobacter cancerogenus TaxID=69218 RepID=UPI00382EB780
MLLGGITDLHLYLWVPVYTKNNFEKELMWVPLGVYSGCQLSVAALNDSEAPVDCSPSGASNHNVNRSNIMACSHDTQTRQEFTYLFLGTPSDKPDVTPVVLRAEANTEQQARSHFLNWNLVFAAQIRTKAPCRLQLFDGGDHFSWLYEQRHDTCTSGVQEVVHG